jgi:predicted amidophosphoribosyltransferase
LGASLCWSCRADWQFTLHPRKLSYKGISVQHTTLPVFSSTLYTPVAQKILLASKENAQNNADELIIEALEFSIESLFDTFKDFERENCILIPMPSRKANNRRRGRSYLEEISHQLSIRSSMTSLSLFSYSRHIKDQSSLNSAERRNNLAHSLVVGETKPLSVVLVDDLITTGATLAEGARAASQAGLVVIGAVTAATAEPVRLAHLASL